MKSSDNLIVVVVGSLFGFLIIMECLQIVKNRELQAQIDELRIIVNQKSLPALILDPLDVR
jgi:hypothetical protein